MQQLLQTACRSQQSEASSHSRSSSPDAADGAPRTSLTHEPLSPLDVDAELWQVLDLCSDEELEAIYEELHMASPLSPLVKTLMGEREPALVELRGRPSVMHKIEARFRFLAADPQTLLRGSRPSYRDTLLAIREKLGVACSSNLSTFDLETELFLHCVEHCVEHVQGHSDPRATSEAAAVALMQDGDGMSPDAGGGPTAPDAAADEDALGSRWQRWSARIAAPIRFGLDELLPSLAKFGSALTVSAVGRSSAQQLTRQLILSQARYLAAARVACGLAGSSGVAGTALGAAGKGLGAAWSRQAALEAAQRGVAAATARHSAVQGVLSFLGPLMWGWLAVDLALKSIGTDYARIIRAVFILAQVRLIRTHGFTPPAPATTATSDWHATDPSAWKQP